MYIGIAAGTGSLIQNGNVSTVGGRDVVVGEGTGSVGSYTPNAGSVTAVNFVQVGRAGGMGTYTMNGGSVSGIQTSDGPLTRGLSYCPA